MFLQGEAFFQMIDIFIVSLKCFAPTFPDICGVMRPRMTLIHIMFLPLFKPHQEA